MQQLSVGDTVVALVEYHLCYGEVMKLNAKSVKVRLPAQKGWIEHTKLFPYEKVLKRGTPCVLVWETWKGVNGAGGYRLDTTKYKSLNIPVEQIKTSSQTCSGFVVE